MATNLVTALGASDIDTKQLVTDLVAAVREPRQQQIDKAKEKAEVAISSIGLLKSALSTLQAAAEDLGSVGRLNQLAISNTDPTTATLTAGGSGVAVAGNHSLTVQQLAQPQRMTSGGFASASSTFSANAFVINVGEGNQTETFTTTFDSDFSLQVGNVTLTSSGATSLAALVQQFQSQLPNDSGFTIAESSGSLAVTWESGGAQAQATMTRLSDQSVVTGTVSGVTTTAINIAANATAAGVASAINSAGLGLSARLVNTGVGATPFRLVVEGASGAANGYSLGVSAGDLTFPTTLQAAQDAEFTLDGIAMTRSNNTVTDALVGVTLTLNRVNATATNLGVSYDTAGITASVERFVEAYNLVNDFIIRATGLPSADDELAGTLQGSTVTRSLRNQLRNLMGTATTASGTTTTRWAEMGVEFDRSGKLTFDNSRFTSVFDANPADAIKAMSNNATRPNLFSGAPSGLAGDLAISVYGMVRTTGTLSDIDRSYQTTLATITEKQTKLDRDIERLTARYERQFSAMDAILSRFKATSKSLESSLDFNNRD